MTDSPGRRALRAVNRKVRDENEEFARQAGLRRYRALWAAQARLRIWRFHTLGFVRRTWGLLVVMALAQVLVHFVGERNVIGSVGGYLTGTAVLFLLDYWHQKAEVAKAALMTQKRLAAESYADLQASVPVLATVLVEEQMNGLGFKRRPILHMGETTYDAETGVVIDHRNPEQMWEKI